MEPGTQLAPPDADRGAGAAAGPDGLTMTRSVETVDRLIAITNRAADTYFALAVVIVLVAVGLLLGLMLTDQLPAAGAIGSTAIAAVAAAPLALMFTERACVNALQAGKARLLRAGSKQAAGPEPPATSSPEPPGMDHEHEHA